jgi:hypothetical protein
MTIRLLRSALAAFVLVGFANSAQALQFAEHTATSCDAFGCDGSTLYLSVQEEVGGTWFVTYTINTDGYTGDRTGFNQIGFKAIQGWTSGTVLSSPVGSVDDWNPVFESPIASNSLCEKTQGNTDKVCVTGFVNIESGGDYSWTFRLQGGTLITDEWHLGAQYANGGVRTAGKIISYEGSGGGSPPVPEPTAALLFGLGAMLMARRAQRR